MARTRLGTTRVSSSDRARIKRLFEEALARPVEEWEPFVREACGGDSQLEEELRSLLAAHHESREFLRTGQVAAALGEIVQGASETLTGQRIGPFEVLGLLGRGGMGAVYRARQENPRREVALKLIDRMIASKTLLRRFEVEAQVLGRLRHPGIAHIYEAGTSRSEFGNRPYFAMELVEGMPIDHFADQKNLDQRDRIRLMIRVCDAVQHAHRVGVIHRDLKPANILVTREGQPKILDFGIARTTDTDLQVTTLAESHTALVGTLPFMSPEQVRGNPDELDTRSDVYALGVLCFQLLTGKLPRDLKNRTITDAILIITSEKPRSLLAASGTAFPSDLETIVAMALEGDKERRYGSASDLAGDLRRYLDGQPVTAHPPGALYQLRKMVQRNRLAAVLVASLVLISLGSAVVMGLQAKRTANERNRANLEAETATTVSEFLESLFAAANPEISRGKQWTARDLLDKGAERIEEELTDQPQVRTRLQVVLGTTYESLGEGKRGVRLLEEAVASGRKIAAEEIEAAARAGFADGLRALARLRSRQERGEDAVALCREALAFSEKAFGVESKDYATSINTLAYHLAGTGHSDEARTLVLAGLKLRERLLGPEHPDVAWSRYQYAWLLAKANETQAAADQFLAACGIWERSYTENHPQTVWCHHDLALILGQLERYDEAISYAKRALEASKHIYGNEHPAVARYMNNVGFLLVNAGRDEEAFPYYLSSLEMNKKLLGPDAEALVHQLSTLSDIAFRSGDLEKTEQLTREQLRLANTHHSDKEELVREAERRLQWILEQRSKAASEK